jgi:hypothetical protein
MPKMMPWEERHHLYDQLVGLDQHHISIAILCVPQFVPYRPVYPTMVHGEHRRLRSEVRMRHKGLVLIASALLLSSQHTSISSVDGFAVNVHQQWNADAAATVPSASRLRKATALFDAKDPTKAAVSITGEELERLLTEWEKPLVIDAYATWYDFSMKDTADIKAVSCCCSFAWRF